MMPRECAGGARGTVVAILVKHLKKKMGIGITGA